MCGVRPTDPLYGTPPGNGATIVHWPDPSGTLSVLRARRQPRLVLVPHGVAPPPTFDELEDWLWVPADERDLYSRLQRLEARARSLPVDLDALTLTADSVLTDGNRSLTLPPVEAALVGCLLGRPQGVRTRTELRTAAWGDAPRTARSLDSRILALRRRIAPLGLAVHAVRGRGFVLGVLAPDDRDRP